VEDIRSSETSVVFQLTTPEDRTLNHRCENLKSAIPDISASLLSKKKIRNSFNLRNLSLRSLSDGLKALVLMICAPICRRIVSTNIYSPGSVVVTPVSILMASSTPQRRYHRFEYATTHCHLTLKWKFEVGVIYLCRSGACYFANRRSQRSAKSLWEWGTLLQHTYHSIRRSLNSCYTKFCKEFLENICINFISLWKFRSFKIILGWPKQVIITERWIYAMNWTSSSSCNSYN
jgi:hypothetical protein